MPSLHVSNGIKISHNEGARQLLILCHGGWKPLRRAAGRYCRQSGDEAQVDVPDGAKLFFYVNEGAAEVGFNVLQEVMRRPDQALIGLKVQPPITMEEAAKLNRPPTPDELGSNIRMVDGFKAGGRSYPNDEAAYPHDYALYYHDEADTKAFAKHQAGEYSTDVDLCTIVKGTSHKRHLSDVFRMATFFDYQVYHFAACRVNR